MVDKDGKKSQKTATYSYDLLGFFGFNKVNWDKEKVCVIGILIIFLFAVAGTVIFVTRNYNHSKREQSVEKQKEENYHSLSASDRETADLYAEFCEMSREDVAEQQVKTKDWEKTAKELEKAFFTIPENKKYQMEKKGYSLEDLQEAERLSVKALTIGKQKNRNGLSWEKETDGFCGAEMLLCYRWYRLMSVLCWRRGEIRIRHQFL